MMSSPVSLSMVALTILMPPGAKPRELRSSILTADTIIRGQDVNPALWGDPHKILLANLDQWYGTLSAASSRVYDEVRDMVRGTRVLDRPVTFFLQVDSAEVLPSGAVVLRGTADVRKEKVSDYYTPDQKKQIAEMKRAIRDKQFRHEKDMRALSDGTPVKRELIRRHHEAIDELGERVRLLRERFNPAAEKRMVAGVTAAIRMTVAPALAKSWPKSKLSRLRSVEVTMIVSDFFVRAPLVEFDRPAAVGLLVGTADQIGGVAYRPSSNKPKAATPSSHSPE